MIIESIVNPEMDENCYIVYDKEKNAVVIDPGSPANIIYDKIKSLGVNVLYILLTHCHYDHIEGLEELRILTNARVCATFECNLAIQNQTKNLSSFFSYPINAKPADVIINDKDIIDAGNMQINVITTPGHTKGGACFLIEDNLFSGDTLFLRSVGRCDFPGGDMDTLINSIKNKLYTLDDEVIVYPGHGNITKIYYEKRYNTFIKG